MQKERQPDEKEYQPLEFSLVHSPHRVLGNIAVGNHGILFCTLHIKIIQDQPHFRRGHRRAKVPMLSATRGWEPRIAAVWIDIVMPSTAANLE